MGLPSESYMFSYLSLRICHCLFCCLVCNFLVLYCPSKYIYVHFITAPLQSVFIPELLCVSSLSCLCCPTVRWSLLMSISKKDQICWFSGFSFFTFLCDALGVLPLLHSLIVDVSVPVLDGVTFLPDLNFTSSSAPGCVVAWRVALCLVCSFSFAHRQLSDCHSVLYTFLLFVFPIRLRVLYFWLLLDYLYCSGKHSFTSVISGKK